MDFGDPPDSRWTVRGPAAEVPALLRRAAEYVDSLGPVPVSGLSLDQGVDPTEVVLTVAFDHWRLPADLDYLDPVVARDPGHGAGPRDDVAFMVALAEELGARTLVDLGCGWGELAVALATGDRRVIGIDPARAMLDVAREREGSERVEWVVGDARALDGRDVDLVTMTGNIPSIYVTDDAWDGLLAAVHAALRPGGHLAFGSWNPEARPWESWGWDVLVLLAANKGARVRATGEGGGMPSADGREVLYAASEWRYRTRDELVDSLTRAGFTVEQAYGDWRRAPLTATSRDIVLVASSR